MLSLRPQSVSLKYLVKRNTGRGIVREKTDRPATEDEIMNALFGRTSGGAPKQIREHLGFAAAAINAHQRGLSVPTVALNYRYEPVQAMTFIANCCGEYGFDSVARHVPAHIMSVVQAQFPGRPGLQPSPRPRGTRRAPK
jgi:hypothetical protein